MTEEVRTEDGSGMMEIEDDLGALQGLSIIPVPPISSF